jgi:hypothetical protein
MTALNARVDQALRERVRRRANDRCEYCHITQRDDPFFQFHVEHIIALQHGGPTEESNLAFACHHCNLHKGPNLSGVDPLSGQIVSLFHPRTQVWDEHFETRGANIIGLTPTGRATVRVLSMNALTRLQLRALPQ